MLDAVRNAFRLPDLRHKLLVTIGILVLYRFAAHIPLPGVDRTALQSLFRGTERICCLSLLNFFSGGGLAQMGIMALGVYPYITASIIMQLLTPIVPQLEELSKEGEQGRHTHQPIYLLDDGAVGDFAGHCAGHAAEPAG